MQLNFLVWKEVVEKIEGGPNFSGRRVARTVAINKTSWEIYGSPSVLHLLLVRFIGGRSLTFTERVSERKVFRNFWKYFIRLKSSAFQKEFPQRRKSEEAIPAVQVSNRTTISTNSQNLGRNISESSEIGTNPFRRIR